MIDIELLGIIALTIRLHSLLDFFTNWDLRIGLIRISLCLHRPHKLGISIDKPVYIKGKFSGYTRRYFAFFYDKVLADHFRQYKEEQFVEHSENRQQICLRWQFKWQSYVTFKELLIGIYDNACWNFQKFIRRLKRRQIIIS